ADRPPDGARQPGALRGHARVPFPGRSPLRLWGRARDDPPLPRARRPRRDSRGAEDPARARGHAPGRNPGTGLVRRGTVRVSDPVSWFVIEPGWEVVGSDGKKVGTVEEVVGDSAEDIFNGLAVSIGLERPRYVPAEQVEAITDGRVRLSLSAAEVEQAKEFEEPPASLELSSEKAGLVD